MEPKALGGGGIYPNISSGLLGVENPLQQQNQQNQQNPHPLHHPQMVSYATHNDTDTHQQQQSIKHGYSYSATKNSNNNNNKAQTALSDEEEAVFTADENSSGDPKRKLSPWHRMKWTDTMVRLLIMAVYYIGDEGGSEAGNNDKKKATGLLQKKGKWKSVSRGMMEKGYYVSPQQCEDKFNDLNKRYKRVNDILGKGTACRVVENQSLLDTMELSPKLKEEVRKLLNSKHLFFREMCAYHNSCGHGNNNNNGASASASANSNVQQSTEAQPQHHHHHHQHQQRCLHSSENGLRMLKEDEDEEEDEESEEDSEEEEEEELSGGEDDNDVMKKRSRRGSQVMMQQLSGEVNGVMEDGGKSGWEKKQWMKKRVVQLEEQQVSYQVEAFELEKQRLKWARFSSKKEREMERDKLENERRRLELERMVLMLRRKELELLNIQHHQHQHSSA